MAERLTERGASAVDHLALGPASEFVAVVVAAAAGAGARWEAAEGRSWEVGREQDDVAVAAPYWAEARRMETPYARFGGPCRPAGTGEGCYEGRPVSIETCLDRGT